MYEFVLWMCLQTKPDCPVWQSFDNKVMVFPSKSLQECEAQWKETLEVPDPEGMKSYHKCQPVEESL